MGAGDSTGRGGTGRTGAGKAPPTVTTADLTESMMVAYGDRLRLDVIAAAVHAVLEAHVHPPDTPVPVALRRKVMRRVRELACAADPAVRETAPDAL